MCVTNTTHRRVQVVTVGPSVLSQRLLGTFPGCGGKDGGIVRRSTVVSSTPASSVSTSPSTGFYGTAVAAPPTFAGFHNNGNNNIKARPKRRRKPQKPGKTAKMNDRHFVVHNYHDHAFDFDDGSGDDNNNNNNSNEDDTNSHGCCEDADDHSSLAHSSCDHHSDQHHQHHHRRRRRGGVAVAFPLKLHAVLDQVERDGLADVVGWQPHGRCFVVRQPREFVDVVMPRYFRQTKLTSFQRQLNLYGFSRLTRGPDAGGYYHEVRGS